MNIVNDDTKITEILLIKQIKSGNFTYNKRQNTIFR